MRVFLVVLLSIATGFPVGAQVIVPVAVGHRSQSADRSRVSAQLDTPAVYSTALPRALLGIIGAAAGLYVGAEMSGLDSPIEDAATGTFVGAFGGATIAAGAWPAGTTCATTKRLLRSFAGSLIGGVLGGVTGILTGSGGGVIFMMTLGAGTGAGVAASGCHR